MRSRILILVILMALAALGATIVVIMTLVPAEQPRPGSPEPEPVGGDPVGAAGDLAGVEVDRVRSKGMQRGTPDGRDVAERGARQAPPPDNDPPRRNSAPTRSDSSSPATTALPLVVPLVAPDAGEADWQDPTNERVLGPKSWMAPVDDGEKSRIDDVFERARAARFDPNLSPRDRQSSIETAKGVVDICFAELEQRMPGVEGRLIVAWESGAEEGNGWIRDVRIPTNYKLEDPQFEACVISGLEGRTFPSGDGQPITVEYPFFYDGH